jgi:hypothetical protein
MLAVLALAGALGGPEATLVWAALAAAPLGALSTAAGSTGGRWAGLTALAPLVLVWAIVPGKLLGAHGGGAFGRAAPSLPWAGAVLVGLSCAGAGLALLARGRSAAIQPIKGASSSAARVALVLLVLGAGLHGLPTRAGLGRSPWPPEIAARALDVSPVTLVAEAAGIDWARRPAIYGPAGADSLGPTLRTPWRPALAGAGALMLGCALWCVALFATRRDQEPPWRRASSSAPSPRS